MKEYFTEAVILDETNTGELDKLIYLYTEDLGQVRAKAKSVRRITSKFAGHLQPLNFVKVRLVEKNGLQIVDAITSDRAPKTEINLALLKFIKDMTFEFQKDRKVWLLLKKILKNPPQDFSYKPFLEALGFSPQFARCAICQSANVVYFSKTEQIFFCRRCGLKIPKDEVILI